MAFASITPVRFGASELAITPSLTTIRTTPSYARDILKTIDIANSNSFSVSVSVYLVPSGGVADSSNLLIPGVSIQGRGVFQWSGTQVTNSGATIQAASSASGVTLTASGGEAV